MTILTRNEFKSDPVWFKLFEVIKSKHVVAEHTIKVLNQNKHIKDFCEEARHFINLDHKFFIHYDVSSWYESPVSAAVKIESIAVYDNFFEYETARVKELNNAKDKNIPNIN